MFQTFKFAVFDTCFIFKDAGDGLQNSTILNIQVTDVDDMDPEFDYNEYYLNITEEVKK